MFTHQFLTEIPKTDLHVHLDGSVRIETILELAKKDGVSLPCDTVEELKTSVFKPTFESLVDYLKCFAVTNSIMRSFENVERIAYELAVDNFNEGVRYFEVRFAPQLHAVLDLDSQGCPKFSVMQVIRAVHEGLQRAKEEFNSSSAIVEGKEPFYEAAIIVCCLRGFNEKSSDYFAHLCHLMPHSPEDEREDYAACALARTAVAAKLSGLAVVAIDIAGPEEGFPPSRYKNAFMIAHKSFLRKTVHAGEAFGPESIFQALTVCHADRIGHGSHIFREDMLSEKTLAKAVSAQSYIDDLVNFVGNRNIILEVCPTSNFQTMPELKHDIKNHPVVKMIQENLRVCINTDNRLVSRTSVTQELSMVVNKLKLDPLVVKDIVLNGFKGSFFPGTKTEKEAYIRSVTAYYEEIQRSHKLFPMRWPDTVTVLTRAKDWKEHPAPQHPSAEAVDAVKSEHQFSLQEGHGPVSPSLVSTDRGAGAKRVRDQQ